MKCVPSSSIIRNCSLNPTGVSEIFFGSEESDTPIPKFSVKSLVPHILKNQSYLTLAIPRGKAPPYLQPRGDIMTPLGKSYFSI